MACLPLPTPDVALGPSRAKSIGGGFTGMPERPPGLQLIRAPMPPPCYALGTIRIWWQSPLTPGESQITNANNLINMLYIRNVDIKRESCVRSVWWYVLLSSKQPSPSAAKSTRESSIHKGTSVSPVSSCRGECCSCFCSRQRHTNQIYCAARRPMMSFVTKARDTS